MIKRILMSVLIIMGTAMAVCAAEDKPVRDGNTIAGHVIELETEEGLPFATVKIIETGAGMTTDENGDFLFKHIPEGEYTLRAEMMGFVPLEKKVTVRKEFAVAIIRPMYNIIT